MSLVIVFAVLGLLFGGLRGLILGAAIGYALGFVARTLLQRTLRRVQSSFVDSTFAVMGALCKADGVVTNDEIRVAEEIFLRLHLTAEQKEAAKAAFNRGKAPDFDLDAEVARFVQVAPRGQVLSRLFLQLQLMAVAADGILHPAEQTMLVRVARGLGLTESDVAQLEALFRAVADGAVAGSGFAPQQRLDDAYAALGVSKDASESEIKRTYRKMMSENHPDKLASKGLPTSMREVAEERAREINAAYDLIKKARGFG